MDTSTKTTTDCCSADLLHGCRGGPAVAGRSGDDLPRDPRGRVPGGAGAVPLRDPGGRGRAAGRARRSSPADVSTSRRSRRSGAPPATWRVRWAVRDEPQRQALARTSSAGRGTRPPRRRPDRAAGRRGRAGRDVLVGGMTADPPSVIDEVMPDRALAARMCAGCPVQRECLELELRTDGRRNGGRVGRAVRGRSPRPAPRVAGAPHPSRPSRGSGHGRG